MIIKSPFLSIVFSFRNEESVLPELIRRVRVVMTEVRKAGLIGGHEMIFVNDASTDRSLTILHEQSRVAGDIKIINMSRTFGVTPCVMAGLASAVGDAVVYMDSDLQDPPEIIADMLQAWQNIEGVDVVHTQRRSRHGESAFKMLITRMGYSILNRYCTVPIPREAGDFKLLSRRVVQQLLKFPENNPFMRGLIAWVGFKQIFIQYDRHVRFAGKSKFFVLSRKVISNFLNSAIVNFSAVPLQLAAYLGFCAIIIDLIFIVHLFFSGARIDALSGSIIILIAILFLGGIQLLCLGMIGLYLHSVHEQTKMRPRYIIESTSGFHQNPAA